METKLVAEAQQGRFSNPTPLEIKTMAYYQDLEAQRDLDQIALESHIDITDTLDEEPEEIDDDTRLKVQEIFERLSAKYDYLDDVNASCTDVEDLLLLTGSNSWAKFQKQWKPQLKEYFQEKKVFKGANEKIELLTKHLIRLEERQKEIEAKSKAHEKQQKQLAEQEIDLQLTIDAKDGLTWDEEATREVTLAKAKLNAIRAQLKKLEGFNFIAALDENSNQIRICKGKIRYHELLNKQEVVAAFNSGDPKLDALVYKTVADKMMFELLKDNGCYDRLDKATMQGANERYSGSDFGVSRYSTYNFEDTSGGVYEKSVEKQDRINEEIIQSFTMIEACKIGFEAAQRAFKPKYEGEYFPNEIDLNAIAQRVAQNAAKYRLKKIQELRTSSTARRARIN